ncbi:MAG: DUF4091 domain-containing protein [Candidatus Omnitrophica bacterium]|nr:DUF4091 domain-containing protein [Candidatus Omnitrophota bacterium]
MMKQVMMRYGITLLIGVAIGSWLAEPKRGDVVAPSHPAVARSGGSEAPAAVKTPQGALFLADFETDRDLEAWERRDVEASRVSEHATHGTFAAKVTFQEGQAPAFMLEDLFDRQPALRDWRGYATLRFDLYNVQSNQQRLILKIKDRDGRAYSEDLYVNGNSAEPVSIRLDDLQAYVNVGHIAQFNLFRWKPRGVGTFYLDAVRLEPAGRSTAAPVPAPVVAAAPRVASGGPWQIAWTSGTTKVLRDPAAFQGHTTNPVQLFLARQEYESAQLVLIGGAESAHVTVAVGPLTHTDGHTAWPSDTVEVRRVDYVRTRPPYYPVTHVGEWPDPLPLAGAVDVPANQVQPVWLTIYAPAALPAGRYEGTITLTDDHGRREQVALQVTVWDFTLPRTSHLKTAFDFYRSRLIQAYREFVPGGAAWEGRLDELQRRYLVEMLRYRLSPVWGADPARTSFAADVQNYLQEGLTVFGVGSRGGSNGNNWPKDPAGLAQVMTWYGQAASALRRQQLLDRSYIYTYDEPKPGNPHVAEVMAAIHQVDPGLKNLLVMHEAPDPAVYADWLKDADILCIRLAALSPELAQRYRSLGKELWMYVSSPSHPVPALVIDYPAIAARILPWMAWKYQATGLLYWCVNFWQGDPWQNPASFKEDQNGNGFLFYPTADGPVPSIRSAALRDGMEDYEYLYLLSQLVAQAKADGRHEPALVAEAERLTAIDPALLESARSYTKDADVLLAQRQAIAAMIVKFQPPSAAAPAPTTPGA